MEPVPLEELIPPPEAINDSHNVYSIAISCIVMGIIATLFVIVRLTLRFRASNLGGDDYAIIPAAVRGILNLPVGRSTAIHFGLRMATID